MFEFLHIQYKLNRLDEIQLARYVKAGCINAAEYQQICGKKMD